MSSVFQATYARVSERIREAFTTKGDAEKPKDVAFSKALKGVISNVPGPPPEGAKSPTPPPLLVSRYVSPPPLCEPDVKENTTPVNTPPTRLAPSMPKVGAPPETPELLSSDMVPPETPELIARVFHPKAPEPQLRPRSIEQVIEDAGTFHGIDKNLSLAIAHTESSFHPDAVSPDKNHSKGLFQLLDGTGMEMHGRMAMIDPYNPFDPEQNAMIGLGYLKRLDRIFSGRSHLAGSLYTVPVRSTREREKVAIAAYNAGEGRVAQAQRRALAHGLDPAQYDAIARYLPESTREYVSRVITKRAEYALNSSKNATV